MESLAVISLAGNIMQFIQFGFKMITTAREYGQSPDGSSLETSFLSTVYWELQKFEYMLLPQPQSGENRTPGRTPINHGGLNGISQRHSQHIDSLFTLSLQCRHDCKRLLAIVDRLKPVEAGGKRWKCFAAALKTVWKSKEIKDLEDRLKSTQLTMILTICTIASEDQEARAVRLEALQEESKRLNVNQSVQLEGIATAIGRLEHEIQRVKGLPSHFTNTGGTNNTGMKVAGLDDIKLLEQRISSLSLSQYGVEHEQAVLRSLSFDNRLQRHSLISEPHVETLKWADESYQSQRRRAGGPDKSKAARVHLANWLRQGKGVFWVSGKPGSGKSTFMKHISKRQETKQLLSKWARSRGVIVASHYFWISGTDLQRSHQGLLRSILHDIFQQLPGLINPVCKGTVPELYMDISSRPLRDGRMGDEHQYQTENASLWELSSLQETLREVARLASSPASESKGVHLCIFIDGLDEFEGNHSELCRDIKTLGNFPRIKLCVSSRPWNEFEQAFGGQPEDMLCMQDWTHNDILHYAKSRLQDHPRWKNLELECRESSSSQSPGEWLVEEIGQRACGVFLWVFLVTKLLLEGLTNWDTYEDICRRLRSFPLELESFFERMLESVDQFYKEKMSAALQVAIAVDIPLHCMAYDFLDREHENSDYVFGVPTKPYGEGEKQALREAMQRRLDSRTRGLLEIDATSGVVTFLHRTVRDYLCTRRVSELLKSKASESFCLPLSILRICISVIKRTSFSGTLSSVRKGFGEYESSELQVLVARALACVTENHKSDCGTATTMYKLVKELDQVLLAKFASGHAKPPSSFPPCTYFREQLVMGPFEGFLCWVLPDIPDFLDEVGFEVLFRLLVARQPGAEAHELAGPWRPRGLEVLRSWLHVGSGGNTRLNSVEWTAANRKRQMRSPWSALVEYATSWGSGGMQGGSFTQSEMSQRRFWTLLENNIFLTALVDRGADPNADLGQRAYRFPGDRRAAEFPWTVFAAYLQLALEIGPEISRAREMLFLNILGTFLSSGAKIWTPYEAERSPDENNDKEKQIGGQNQRNNDSHQSDENFGLIPTCIQYFYQRVRSSLPADRAQFYAIAYNHKHEAAFSGLHLGLLASVTDRIISTAEDRGVRWAAALCVQEVVEMLAGVPGCDNLDLETRLWRVMEKQTTPRFLHGSQQHERRKVESQKRVQKGGSSVLAGRGKHRIHKRQGRGLAWNRQRS
ncbi:hypothetical protein QBC37DRAFT_419906, partial [Rhypophila decipiens]